MKSIDLVVQSLLAATFQSILNYLEKVSALCFNEAIKIANSMIENCSFQENLKKADLSPVSRTGETTAKKNFRPISVTCNVKGF